MELRDPSTHRPCVACGRWLLFEAGASTPRGSGLAAELHPTTALIVGIGGLFRGRGTTFVCDQCSRRRRIRELLLWCALAVAVGIAFVLGR